jgi:endonuclease YncB( thermonuclease family)
MMSDCRPIAVVDSNRLRCWEQKVRLLGIDAPELPGLCRQGRVGTSGGGRDPGITLWARIGPVPGPRIRQQ